jgi:hypothetical protein
MSEPPAEAPPTVVPPLLVPAAGAAPPLPAAPFASLPSQLVMASAESMTSVWDVWNVRMDRPPSAAEPEKALK